MFHLKFNSFCKIYQNLGTVSNSYDFIKHQSSLHRYINKLYDSTFSA